MSAKQETAAASDAYHQHLDEAKCPNKEVCYHSVVHILVASSKAGERVEMTCLPQLVDAENKLDFLLLNGLLVEAGRYLGVLNQVQESANVEKRHDEAKDPQDHQRPAENVVGFETRGQIHCLSSCFKVAIGTKCKVEEDGQKGYFSKPKEPAVPGDRAMNVVEAIANPAVTAHHKPEDAQQQEQTPKNKRPHFGVPPDLDKSEVDWLTAQVRRSNECSKHDGQVLARGRGPILVVDEKEKAVELGDAHNEEQLLFPKEGGLQIACAPIELYPVRFSNFLRKWHVLLLRERHLSEVDVQEAVLSLLIVGSQALVVIQVI